MASNPSKPTIVLVPGAWHGVEGYAGVMAQLQAAGYPTISVPLPSVNAPTPLQSIDDDVQAIRKAVIGATRRGQDVVIVGHSYGGVPMSQAAENLQKGGKDTGGSGGVVRLFFCTAFVLAQDTSIIDLFGGNDAPWWKVDGDSVEPQTSDQIFYNGMAEEQQKLWDASLRPFSYRMFYNRMTHAGYKHIPSAFLYCTKDNAIPFEFQKGMVQSSGVEFYEETLETNHSPFLTHPKETADAIRRAAGEKV